MTDDAGTSTESTIVEPGSGPAGEPAGIPAPSGGGNPAWEPIRSKLGPSFGLVEEHLKEWDRSAQQRITDANSKVQRYEQLGKYEELQQAYQLQQRLNQDPRQVYSLLENYLRQTGQLEDLNAAVEDDEQDPESDVERQLQQLGQSQQQIQEFLAQQEYQRQEAAATADFDRQMAGIRQANPHLSDDDETEIYQRALSVALQTDRDPDLNAAAEEFNALRTRLLTAPRAGDSAPRLVPSGGGAPGRGEPQNVAKMTPAQRQSYITDMLKANQRG